MSENKDLTIILSKCGEANKAKIMAVKNQELLAKIASRIGLCNPKDLFIHTGSAEDFEYIKKMSLEAGEEMPLAMGGHTIHFDPPAEQGRVVKQTYVVEDEDMYINSATNALPRVQADDLIQDNMKNIMDGKTMLVGFYIRGPVGAPTAYASLTISDTWYLAH
ncbi:MAG: hypothetical protein KAJ70_04915 [Candidatus Omnitrophica bacterium]|nr:hypothetical protein [Candidatus Omnitrophota bacterium]